MSFSSKGMSENLSRYITPGVHLVKIAKIESETSDTGVPKLILSFVPSDATDEEGATKIRLAFSEKAFKISMPKLIHLATKIVTREQFDAAESETVDQYAIKLSRILLNKPLWVNFSGREYEYNGEVKTAADLGFPEFAETYTPGTASTLVHDPAKHVRKLTTTTAVNTATDVMLPPTVAKTVDDDLPF